MPLKQTALFSFDEEPLPATSRPEPAAPRTPKPEPLPTVVSEPAIAINPTEKRGRKKLSEQHTAADALDIPDDQTLFEKKYYPIGVVARMFGVNISLLRFWEKEFDILKPKKNGKGDRLFRPEDVRSLKMIYHLLREKKYTINGAREFLRKNKKADENFQLIEDLKKLKLFLTEIKLSL